MRLTPALASRYVRLSFASAANPPFGAAGDWSLDVQRWWLLLRIARAYPRLPHAEPIRDAARAAFSGAPGALPDVAPATLGWLLQLHAEAALHRSPVASALRPLAQAAAARLAAGLDALSLPVRSSGRGNSAFAMLLAYGWAEAHDRELALGLAARARGWFGDDRDARGIEPDGDALISPVLTEAQLMLRVLPYREFDAWFEAFLPGLDAGEPAALFKPAPAGDRGDPRAARLDALNLSRAWNWRTLGRLLPLGHAAHTAGERHLAAGLPWVGAGTAAEPLLTSFALLALLPEGD